MLFNFSAAAEKKKVLCGGIIWALLPWESLLTFSGVLSHFWRGTWMLENSLSKKQSKRRSFWYVIQSMCESWCNKIWVCFLVFFRFEGGNQCTWHIICSKSGPLDWHTSKNLPSVSALRFEMSTRLLVTSLAPPQLNLGWTLVLFWPWTSIHRCWL